MAWAQSSAERSNLSLQISAAWRSAACHALLQSWHFVGVHLANVRASFTV
jgi:hypothetical protein